MNIPVKVKKLLESSIREDVILGLETFCRLNDNPEFDIHVSNLLYYHILYKDIKIRYKDFNSLFMTQPGYYFKYKGECFLASTFAQSVFKVIDSHINKILYEYNGKN